MQRASSSSHEAEGDHELSSAGVRTRGHKPMILNAQDNVHSRTPSTKCCKLYASLHDRFRLEVRILFYPMRTWKLAAWMTLIIAGMRVVGGTGEGVQVEGGAGVRGAAPAEGSRKKLKMFHEQILSRNEAWFVKIRKEMTTEKKGCESGFPYSFLTHFTKFFLQGSTLLDFGFLTEKASWIYRIFIIWCRDKKKIKKSNSSKIGRSPPILIKFGIKHHSVLVHLPTKFQLDKSKFTWVKQFRKNSQEIQNLKKFERFNRFSPNSIPKFLDRCNIFVCSFRATAQILRKLELPRPFFEKFKIP